MILKYFKILQGEVLNYFEDTPSILRAFQLAKNRTRSLSL